MATLDFMLHGRHGHRRWTVGIHNDGEDPHTSAGGDLSDLGAFTMSRIADRARLAQSLVYDFGLDPGDGISFWYQGPKDRTPAFVQSFVLDAERIVVASKTAPRKPARRKPVRRAAPRRSR